MRNKKKIAIYPVYFDARRSRRTGRRVPKTMAVVKPELSEIEVVLKNLKIDYEVDEEAKHPSSWYEDYQGRLLISKKTPENTKISKADLVKKIAKLLIAVKKKKKEKRLLKEKQARHARGQQSHKKYLPTELKKR